jgi:hypothetical protein
VTEARTRFVLLLGAAGCNWHVCAEDELDFQLAEPGDEITVIVRACAENDRGGFEVSMELDAPDMVTAPIVVEVDDLQLHPGDQTSWSGGSGFGDAITREVCDRGDRITLRRLDDASGSPVTGTFSLTTDAPHGRSCTASLELEQ